MTPDEILRDALDKIRAGLGAHRNRLDHIKAERSELQAHIAKGEAAESALLAVIGVCAEAPIAEPEPVRPLPADLAPVVEAPASVPGPVSEPVAPIASVVVEAAPAGPPLRLADPGRDEAVRIAQSQSPTTRSERQVRILAAAGVVWAYATVANATAARFGVHGSELAPSMLRKIGVTELEVAAVAKALAAKVGANAARTKSAREASAPAPIVQAPPAISATIRALADDLLVDLPTMLAATPAGVSASTIADWFGCTVDQARSAAALLIAEHAAIAENKMLRLPAEEAVPA